MTKKKKNYFREFFSFWGNLSKSEKATWIATGLGFIVDTIAILQIISFNQSKENTTPFYASPELAFGIWIIAGFSYLAFLHAYWENNKQSCGFSSTFTNFLYKDLLLGFKRPSLLFPGVILILLLFAISTSETSGFLTTMLSVSTLMGLIFLFMAKSDPYALGLTDDKNSSKELSQNFKDEVENDWDFWAKRLNIELSRNFWITTSELEDITIAKGFEIHQIQYILALFAFKYPNKAKYGTVWSRNDGQGSDDKKVVSNALIDLESFNFDKYYFS